MKVCFFQFNLTVSKWAFGIVISVGLRHLSGMEHMAKWVWDVLVSSVLFIQGAWGSTAYRLENPISYNLHYISGKETKQRAGHWNSGIEEVKRFTNSTALVFSSLFLHLTTVTYIVSTRCGTITAAIWIKFTI